MQLCGYTKSYEFADKQTMQNERTNQGRQIAPMQKRRETMADGRRYIIYYTVERAEESSVETAQDKTPEKAEANEDV